MAAFTRKTLLRSSCKCAVVHAHRGLLFITLTKLLPQKNLLIPFLTTLLFIAHPIHTEVVVNIKSRDEILCFLFVIASVNFLMNYMKSSKIISLIAALFCFLLSLLSKESANHFYFYRAIDFTFFHRC
jgi:hypothetical protein